MKDVRREDILGKIINLEGVKNCILFAYAFCVRASTIINLSLVHLESPPRLLDRAKAS